MRKLLLSFLLLLAYSSYSRSTLFVQDSAKLFTDNERYLLNDKLQAFEKKTSNEIAIITIPDLKDNDISEYAIKLHHDKGIGKKGVDNGLLILIAPNSRKCFISVGYGLEQYLPDLIVNRIGEKDLPVYFKQKQYYKGVDLSINEIFTFLDKVNPEIIEQYNIQQKRKQAEYEKNTTFVLQIVGLIFLFGVISYILWHLNQKRLEKIEEEKIEKEKTISLKKQIKDKYINIDYMISRISNYKIGDNKNLLLKSELDKHNNYTYYKEIYETITNSYELNKIFNNASDIYISLNKFYDKVKEIDNLRENLKLLNNNTSFKSYTLEAVNIRINSLGVDVGNNYNDLEKILKEYNNIENIKDLITTCEINNKTIDEINKKIESKRYLISKLDSLITTLNNICNKYESAVKYKNEISLDKLEKLKNISLKTISKYPKFNNNYLDANKKLDYLNTNYNSLDILTLGFLLYEAYKSYTDIDVMVEKHNNELIRLENERKRKEQDEIDRRRREEKRKKEQDEEDEHRRNSSSSSSYFNTDNSYNWGSSNSSDSGSSSFGGGDSGGAGAGGDF